MKTTLILDGDIIAYQSAASSEITVDFDCCGGLCCESYPDLLEDKIKAIILDWISPIKHFDNILIALTNKEKKNWRKDIYPEYKANRKDVRKPELLVNAIEYLEENYNCISTAGLEADDVIGIEATTHEKGRIKIIVSTDKDFLQIPCRQLNPVTGKKLYPTTEKADWWHMIQTLAGDPVDNYKGVPRVGVKTATKILDNIEKDSWWNTVLSTYEKKELTEEYALIQAQIARICRSSDYDKTKQEVKLWTPKTR